MDPNQNNDTNKTSPNPAAPQPSATPLAAPVAPVVPTAPVSPVSPAPVSPVSPAPATSAPVTPATPEPTPAPQPEPSPTPQPEPITTTPEPTTTTPEPTPAPQQKTKGSLIGSLVALVILLLVGGVCGILIGTGVISFGGNNNNNGSEGDDSDDVTSSLSAPSVKDASSVCAKHGGSYTTTQTNIDSDNIAISFTCGFQDKPTDNFTLMIADVELNDYMDNFLEEASSSADISGEGIARFVNFMMYPAIQSGSVTLEPITSTVEYYKGYAKYSSESSSSPSSVYIVAYKNVMAQVSDTNADTILTELGLAD